MYEPCSHDSHEPLLARPQPIRFFPAAHVAHEVHAVLPAVNWKRPELQSRQWPWLVLLNELWP